MYIRQTYGIQSTQESERRDNLLIDWNRHGSKGIEKEGDIVWLLQFAVDVLHQDIPGLGSGRAASGNRVDRSAAWLVGLHADDALVECVTVIVVIVRHDCLYFFFWVWAYVLKGC